MPHKFELDHVSLLVRSLEVTTRFYTEVLGLEIIENGTRLDHIRWFGFDGWDALHVTQGDFGGTHLEKPTHFALRVKDFDAFVADLRARGIRFWDWPGTPDNVTGRPDGFHQVYLQDPDGYWIEINDHGPSA
jgi:lactoylglutathione lyase